MRGRSIIIRMIHGATKKRCAPYQLEAELNQPLKNPERWGGQGKKLGIVPDCSKINPASDNEGLCVNVSGKMWSPIWPNGSKSSPGLPNLLQKTCWLTLCREKCDRFFVEGNEGFPTEPIPFIGNDAIGKIPASFEHRQASLYGRPIHFHIGGGK